LSELITLDNLKAHRARRARRDVEAAGPPPGLVAFLASLLWMWIAGEIRLALRSRRPAPGAIPLRDAPQATEYLPPRRAQVG
jgi:hypothetical protein